MSTLLATQALATQSKKIELWLRESALPLWSTKGINPNNGASYERFLFDGRVDTAVNNRVRVQARQIFVFSVAHELGWIDNGQDIVIAMAKFYESTGRHPQEPGYIHLLSADYEPIDFKQDLYDHAFALLSYAWRFRVFKDDTSLKNAQILMAHLDHKFGNKKGGWIEGDYTAHCRRQNPHMHLFEAFLSFYEATKEAKWLARAGEMFALFENTFFDSRYGILREYFNDDWSILNNSKGDIVEPGHMMEWVWLLRWYETLTQRNVSYYANTLYEKALKDGLAPSGLMYDETSPTGDIIKNTKRCWPMTELIKASIAQARAAKSVDAKKVYEQTAATAAETLYKFFMVTDLQGAYIDQIGGDDKVISDVAPASTMYHLLVASMEMKAYTEQS